MSKSFNMLLLCACLLLAGCRDKPVQTSLKVGPGPNSKKEQAESKSGNLKSVSGQLSKDEIDVDRLSRIQDSLQKAGLAGYAVVFGGVDQGAFMVSIDYSLFDRLSDDAVACMIVDAIHQKHRIARQNDLRSETAMQSQIIQAPDMVAIDIKSGRYIAKTGFSSAGFEEWLQEQKMLMSPENTLQPISDVQRNMYFMKGYQAITKTEQ